jgi:hypothetical protein
MVTGTERRWLLPAFFVLVVSCLFFVGSGPGLPENAHGQLQSDTGSGVLVVPVRLGRDSYGLAMVDTLGQTMWIYELNNRGPAHSRLKLLAARSWKYDRLLQQYNTAEPKPERVKMLLQDFGRQQEEQNEEKQQDSDVNTFQVAEPNDSNMGS